MSELDQIDAVVESLPPTSMAYAILYPQKQDLMRELTAVLKGQLAQRSSRKISEVQFYPEPESPECWNQ
jgi:hypothetical protein